MIDEAALNQTTLLSEAGDMKTLESIETISIIDNAFKQFDTKIQTMNQLFTIVKAQLSDVYDYGRSSSLSLDSKF